MNRHVSNRDISIPENWDRRGLPGWTYHSDAFLELEKQEIFRKHWQVACHVSDLPESGDYIAFDMCGERALVLRGAARPKSFPDLVKVEFGLQPLEAEVWNGFVFVRFEKGPQSSVAELFQPFAEEIAHYDIADMVPSGEMWTMVSKVNWKSVRDVDNEGYHVALAHPALQDLYGRSYYDEPFVNGMSRSYAECNENGRRWSVRNYLKAMQPRPGMPDYLERAWVYYGMFPNAVIAVTPELAQFYQEFPLSTGETLLRGSIYRYRDETRQQTVARKLAARIDYETMGEDVRLTEWSNEAMSSSAFQGFYLSDLEYGVRSHHDHIRAILPVSTLDERPKEDEVAKLNSEMTIDF